MMDETTTQDSHVQRRDNETAELHQALQNFDSVVRRGAKISSKKFSDTDVFLACQRIGSRIGIDIKRSRFSAPENSFKQELQHVANASKFRFRKIMLPEKWPQKDYYILLGQLRESQAPVVIEYTKFHGVIVYGPDDYEQSRPLTDELAASIQTVAYQIYAPLPDEVLSVAKLMAYGLKQHAPEVVVYLVTMAIVTGIAFAIPMATGFLFNNVVPNYEQTLLFLVCLALFVAYGMTFIMNLVGERAALRLEGLVGRRLQAAVIDRLLRLPQDFFGSYATPDLMLRVNTVETTRRSLTMMVLGSVNGLMTIVYGIALLFYYHPPSAGVAFALILALLIVANLIGFLGLKAFYQGEAMTANVLSMVYQMVESINLIRIFDAEIRSFTRWADNYLNMRGRLVRSMQYENLYKVVQKGFDVIALACTFWVISMSLDEENVLSLGDFLAFVTSFSMVLASLSQLAGNVISVYRMVPMLKRVAPILETVPDVTTLKSDPGDISGAIDLVKVSHSYDPEQKPVIDDLSLSIKPGDYIGIVGRTGCGKSTLLKLLLGFLTPQQGRVYFDRQDLQRLDLELTRRQFGVVLQANKLFAATIYENIATGREVGTDEVMAAAEAVALKSDIDAMPMGLDTVVTESGTAFSGGQIQRIALARAILSEPKVLFLDEATSALDNLSQQRVVETLKQLTCTRIVVAHRFVTVKHCDRILVMDQGRIVQQGRFDELLKQDGLFKDLARRQIL